MNSCHIRLLIAAACSLQFQHAVAQASKFGVSIKGEMHIPTGSECIDALNTGQVLGPSGDGRLLVAKGEVVYWIAITPTYIDCTGAKFPPREE